MAAPRPNLVLLITDQQRAPMHWPQQDGWLEALAPHDAALRRAGTSFTRAFCATAMCSPSRASFLTGTYPSRHGVTLTLTEGDLWPDPHNLPDVLRTTGGLLRSGEVDRGHLVRRFLRGLTRSGPRSGREPELPAGVETLGTRLRAAGYHVAYKGKWHLTKPLAGGHAWAAADARRLERDFGFAEWEPPDAGENARPEHFGAGTAGTSGQGWDEDFTCQAERFLARADLPEPFCLVVSLVNPHDVLGYPATYERGGFRREDFAELGVPLPPTLDESLAGKPRVQSLMKLGQTAYLGALRGRAAQQDYVDFYAYLHGVVDRHVGRVLAALGDPADPGSLRSRTVVARFSDHGEMGLSHGGLRQKMFNAYEETIRVPLVLAGPGIRAGAETAGPASLVDLVPTLLGLAGAPADGTLDGRDLGPALRGEVAAVRDDVLFTYDDHQAGTASQEVAGQPSRIRCVRGGRWKYAVYLDPAGRTAPEYELYDLDADPLEAVNLVDVGTGAGRTAAAERERRRLAEALRDACAQTATLEPALP